MTKSEISEIARKMAAMRKRHSGGRPKKLTPCPFGCGIELGVVPCADMFPSVGVQKRQP